jgi:hypothetical protein
MAPGKNQCAWLVQGGTETCGKSCRGAYCGVHNDRMRKGGGTTPCRGCGVGVTNKHSLCARCGYHNIITRLGKARARAFQKEFKRLAMIEIPC